MIGKVFFLRGERYRFDGKLVQKPLVDNRAAETFPRVKISVSTFFHFRFFFH